MNQKTLIILGVVVVILGGATFFYRDNNVEPATTGDSVGLPAQTGLVIGNNAIYVADQAPAQAVLVAVVRLEQTGLVVIHEDKSGQPGQILGTSAVLSAGETKNLTPIKLSRLTKDGETLYAMLHLDDGDGVFDPAKDRPVFGSLGDNPIMMIFTVSLDATEPGAVNLL